MYYSVVYNDVIIEIVENPRYVLWIDRIKRFVPSDTITANGIAYKGEIYHLLGKPLFENYSNEYKTVSLVEISEQEYLDIKSSIESDKSKIIEHKEPSEIERLEQRLTEAEKYREDFVNSIGEILKSQLQDALQSDFVMQLKTELETELEAKLSENIKDTVKSMLKFGL